MNSSSSTAESTVFDGQNPIPTCMMWDGSSSICDMPAADYSMYGLALGSISMQELSSKAEREQVAAACRRLAAAGLVHRTAGNVSVRAGEQVAITPTGAELADTRARRRDA